MKFTPIFVADRPVSLRILEGLNKYDGEFGILAHAYTTENFKYKFREFNQSKFKIGDSGIYQGKDMPYPILFAQYIRMGVTHGIIKDSYRNSEKTLESAIKALEIYRQLNLKNQFKLVGVAQGNSISEYIRSYEQQRNLGYSMVAIGGLLSKIEKHKRMVKVKKEEFLTKLVRSIRSSYPDDEIFLLGAFNRARIGLFKELNIWGADYKGWIFRYNKDQSHQKHDRFKQTVDYIGTEIFPLVNKKRLLIMSCSQTKNQISGKTLDVYNGKSYQVLKKYLKDYDGLDVRIISAKYGLISKDKEITYYEEKLTTEKALMFRRKYSKEVKTLCASFEDVFVFGSTLYRTVIGGKVPNHSEGPIGKQLNQLKSWLYEPIDN